MIVTRVRDLLLEQASIEAILGDRIYPVTWPDAPEFPLVILQRIVGVGHLDFQGEAGIELVRLQVEVYTDAGYSDCERIAMLIRKKMHGFKGGPISAPCAIDLSECINNADRAVPETERAGPRLRCRILELRIWNREV